MLVDRLYVFDGRLCPTTLGRALSCNRCRTGYLFFQLQHEHDEDIQEGQKHHEHWNEFWGRPGGGAPKGTIKQKENLEYILYQLPIINRLREADETKNCGGDCKELPTK